ncbi:XVIPCD domain-containing protein [Lysobacter antibioticus]|uniref:XVIPCD domain-containing protein n=1 Tax=Lysobacter antibioticus TaxID=84531 RepID=UPI00126A0405|nr:XVIPCD domain-containing protein [Lysobacter antibioticus]
MHEPETETEQDVSALLDSVNDIGADTIEYANLKQLFADSPHLRSQLRRAMAEGGLTSIVLLPETSTLGGLYTYTNGVISLSREALSKSPAEGGTAAAWIVGHELEHCVRSAELHARVGRDIEIANIFATDSTYDYTDVVGFYVQAMREDEAHSEIAGWNAHLDVLKKNGGKDVPDANDIVVSVPGRKDLYFQPSAGSLGYDFKPEIEAVLNSDRSMPASTEAIARISQCYFDAPPERSRLGPSGNCDYRHYYAAMALGEIHQTASSQIQVRLSALHLDTATLWASGVDLSPTGIPIFSDASMPAPANDPVETATLPAPGQPEPRPLFYDSSWLGMSEQRVGDEYAASSDAVDLSGSSLLETRMSAKWNPDGEAPVPFTTPPGSPPLPPVPQSPELLDLWIASLLSDEVGPSTGSALGKREFDDESPRASQGSPKIPRIDREFNLMQPPDPPQTSSSTPQSQHPLYLQALHALQTHSDPELRSRAPETLQCLAAGLAYEAQKSDLGRIDHVVASEHNEYLFAIRGGIPNDPANQYVQVDQRVASTTPLERSLAELAAITPPDAAHAMGAASQTPHERHLPPH